MKTNAHTVHPPRQRIAVVTFCIKGEEGEIPGNDGVAVMRNRLTVQTHIGERVIDSKNFVTTPRLQRHRGGRVRRGGGVFCKVQTAAFHTEILEIGFRISALHLALHRLERCI